MPCNYRNLLCFQISTRTLSAPTMYANIAIKNAKELSTYYPISARIANSNDTTTAGLLGA